MQQPSPFHVGAYLNGDQPLWRAFWLWSVGVCGTVAVAYWAIESHLSRAVMEHSWMPLVRMLAVWTFLGILSLTVIVRCHANTKSRFLAGAAFALIGLATAFTSFVLLWFLL